MKKKFIVTIEEKWLIWIDSRAAEKRMSRTKYVQLQLERLGEKIRQEKEDKHISVNQSKIKFK